MVGHRARLELYSLHNEVLALSHPDLIYVRAFSDVISFRVFVICNPMIIFLLLFGKAQNTLRDCQKERLKLAQRTSRRVLQICRKVAGETSMLKIQRELGQLAKVTVPCNSDLQTAT